MYRLFINFLLFLFLGIFAEAKSVIIIDENSSSIESFPLEYFVDTTGIIALEDLMQKPFLPSISKALIGINKEHTWLRFSLKNITNTDKKLSIHQHLAYLSQGLSFREVQEHKVIFTEEINMSTPKGKERLDGSIAIFDIILHPNEYKTFYIKNQSNMYQAFDIAIYNAKQSKYHLRSKNIFIFMVVGMLLILILYHLMLYLYLGYKEYLYYLLYLLTATLTMVQIYGILANTMDFYLTPENQYFLLISYLNPIFLALFSQKMLNTKIKYPKENTWLNSIIFLFSMGFIFGFFNLIFSLYLIPYFYLYLFVVLLRILFIIGKKNNPLAKVLFWGNLFFVLFLSFFVFLLIEVLPFVDFTFYAGIYGVLIEALILSFVISYRVKELQNQKMHYIQDMIRKDELLKKQSKLAQMGEMISMIAHQWRQPLSAVSSSIMTIKTNIALNKFDLAKPIGRENFMLYLEEKFDNIDECIYLMSDTIDDFRNFYQKQHEVSAVNINQTIEKSLRIIQASLQAKSIVLDLKLNSTQNIDIFENDVIQVVLNIIQNAQNALEEEKNNTLTQKTISIESKDSDAEVILIISNNGGQIDENILEDIFKPYFTTKQDKNGSGIGLYMSQIIIQKHHQGRLEVLNTSFGVSFLIGFTYSQKDTYE